MSHYVTLVLFLYSNSEVFCDHCIDGLNGPAVVFCCTCHQFLCKPCHDHHRSGRQLSKHNIIGLDQVGAKHLQAITKPREYFCTQPNHEDNKLNFCLIHMCGDCVPVSHKDHSITELSTIANNHRALGGLIPTELSAVLKNVEPISLIPNTPHGVSAVVPTGGLVIELSKFGYISDLSPSPSSSTWTSTSVAKMKTDFHVKVESKTSKGTVCPHGGLQMKAEMRSNNGAVVHGEVEDHGDGTYTTTLIPLTAGPHQLLITLDGQHVQNSPHYLNVLHNKCTLGNALQVIKCRSHPYCVAIHDNGDLYVGTSAGCIDVFDTTGYLKKTIGSPGQGDHQLNNPHNIIIIQNMLHVADCNNNCIKQLRLEGTFIKKISADKAAGVLVDEYYRMFVSDCQGNKIYVFNHNGGLIFTIDGNVTGDHSFKQPYGIAFDPLGNIHVAAYGSNTIKVFTKEGGYIRKYGDLQGPWGIVIDSEGYIFVTENGGHCISIFDPQGNKIHTAGGLNYPHSLALDSRTSSLYVANYNADVILKYSL